MLVWSDDGTISIWDTATRSEALVFNHEAPVTGAKWNRTGSMILSFPGERMKTREGGLACLVNVPLFVSISVFCADWELIWGAALTWLVGQLIFFKKTLSCIWVSVCLFRADVASLEQAG